MADGGAIADYNTSGASIPPLSVTASSFVGNQAGYSGGAIDTASVAASISDSLFSGNFVSGSLGGPSVAQGGAISAQIFYVSPPNLSVAVTGCTFVNNQAFLTNYIGNDIAQGGAIWDQLAMTVTDSDFSDNSADSFTGQGGAIADDTGTAVTIAHSSFVGNQAVGQTSGATGGAIFTNLLPSGFPNPVTTTAITACSFTDNTATGRGGAGGTECRRWRHRRRPVPDLFPPPAVRSRSPIRPSRAIRPGSVSWK